MGQRFDESLDNGEQARSFFEGKREGETKEKDTESHNIHQY